MPSSVPVLIFFAPAPFYPHANLRHYAFLAQGIPDTAERARKRGIGYVLRRYPDHSLLKFCEEVKGIPGYWGRKSYARAKPLALARGEKTECAAVDSRRGRYRAFSAYWRKNNTQRGSFARACKSA